jgi:hypothetical protein
MWKVAQLFLSPDILDISFVESAVDLQCREALGTVKMEDDLVFLTGIKAGISFSTIGSRILLIQNQRSTFVVE